jgi:hypothetical protein
LLPEYVYVASSWRCPAQPAVIKVLEAAKIPCYDFRNPEPGDTGFRWTDIDKDMSPFCRCDHTQGRHGFCAAHGEAPYRDKEGNRTCSCPKTDAIPQDTYLSAIEHPIAWAGFTKDFEAMQKADTFVLVLPCGRSAHLELGWAIGAGKRTAILLDDPVTPELMYKMVDFIAKDMFSLLGWLGVED